MTLKEELYMVYFGILVCIGVYILYKAYKKGAILQVLDIVTGLGTLMIAYMYHGELALEYPIYQDNLFMGQIINPILWFIIIVVALRLVYFLIEWIIQQITKLKVIGTLNRIIGLLLGLIKVFILSILVCMVCMSSLVDNGNDFIRNTPLHYVKKIMLDIKEVTSVD